jgi:PAS domain S-box-containing protein
MKNQMPQKDLEERIQLLEKRIVQLESKARALKSRGKRYYLLLESLNDGVALLDAQGRIVIWNKSAEKIFGIRADQIVGHRCLDVQWPTIRQDGSWMSAEDQPGMVTLRSGEPCREVLVGVLGSGGDVRWIAVNSTPVRLSEGGKTSAVAVSFADITDRRKVEEALRESEDRFRRLFEEAPVAIQGYTQDGVISFWNKANETTYGYTREEAVGKNIMDLIIPGELREKAAQIIRHGARTGEMPPCSELLLRRKNGSRVPVLSSHVAIMRKSGETEMYCLDNDLTELKRLKTELQQTHKMQAELQQAQKMEAIGTLAGGIAHDFNNILGIIVGNCELALDDVPSGNPAHFFLQEIQKAGLRGTDIVRQLLTFCRKNEENTPKPMHLLPVFEDVLRFIRATIPTTINIRHEILAHEDTICSDPTVIYQVLMNLCTNAAHAMEQTGGAIMIRMQNIFLDAAMPDIPPGLKSGKYIQLMVTDTGPGIDPAVLDRIFDPYFTTKEVGKGTGMGLAVVQGIVKSHYGAVTVINRPGRGTTFTVYLPLSDATTAEETWKPKILELGDETILFVDDEKSIVDMCGQMLTRLGYRVETAMSPLAALDKFQSNPKYFDLVITDMTMPQMTGLQLTKRIKAVNPKIPVVLCTGFSTYITPENAEAMGIQGYLMKPIVKLDMAKTVRQVLDSSQKCRN